MMENTYQQLHLKKQQGAVIIILTVGMAALLAVAGLALDSGNLFLNKAKLQNAADVSALSAAVALNAAGGDYPKAEAAAKVRFQSVILTEGNQALQEAYNSGEISLAVSTSADLSPFVASNAAGDWYVRVEVSAMQLDSFFLRVIGIDTLSVPATAVAGRTPVGVSNSGDNNPICGVVPMMVCGNPDAAPSEDSDDYWGYTVTPGKEITLKSPAKCKSEDENGVCQDPTVSEDWNVGSGNFQLIQLTDEFGKPLSGGDGVRDAMAGTAGCINAIQGEEITTEPGNVVGPVAQGFNTRFGIYQGNMQGTEDQYPGDYVSGNPRGKDTMTYEYYEDAYDLDKTGCGHCYSEGEDHRRIVAVPIGDCTESTNGKGDIPLLDLGCFFVTRKADQQGIASQIHGEFIKDCPVGVTPPTGEDPTDSTGTTGENINKGYIIQLYKNPGSRDS